MTISALMDQPTPRLEHQSTAQGNSTLVLGQWTAAQFAQPKLFKTLQAALGEAPAAGAWDLTRAEQLDHVGGQLLWDHWGQKWPEPVELLPPQRAVLERVAQFTAAPPQRKKPSWRGRYLGIGESVLRLLGHIQSFVQLLGTHAYIQPYPNNRKSGAMQVTLHFNQYPGQLTIIHQHIIGPFQTHRMQCVTIYCPSNGQANRQA